MLWKMKLIKTRRLTLTGGAIDLPLYDPKTVRGRTRGGLCLSQVSFKLGVENTLHLTVLYRSHPYIAKALSDFLGLAGLQAGIRLR